MQEDRLYSDPALVDFYDVESTGRADFDHCRQLARGRRSVLDLGCGTGELAASLSGAAEIFGVDPAGAMLDVARRRLRGDAVTWVEGDARSVRLGRQFELVLLTGHAFQVFLTADDRRAVIQTIAAHLAPGGHFVFDTRNPAREEWREWTPERSRRTIEHPIHGLVTAWNGVERDPATGIVTYRTLYRLPDGVVLFADSQIAFPDREEIAQAIEGAGLAVERWMGDWNGGDWGLETLEIIPFGKRARDTLT
ncbi:MAG: class I SAM-dependent methyltransferase [Rhizobiaceae bacterium]|nr:MAG: class I SAM-dependent methyltransferase [Rhizobiaceae bacterium]CAG0954222.1 Cypemycin N-terminal methyltransferase [Rhizobiaceae bacterium]